MTQEIKKVDETWVLKMGAGALTHYPKDLTVSQLYEEIAAEYGNRIALSTTEGSLNYAELNLRSNQLARHLQALGVKKGSFVGLSCERSFDMIIVILGIVKAGAAYLPIDPDYPNERKMFMIEDSGISFLVTQQKFKDRFQTDALRFICLDSESKELNKYRGDNLDCLNTSSDPAYVYYTSGSTGQPKGAIIPHRGIARLVRNTNWTTIYPEDRFLQIQNISFDGSTFEIWGALLNGASLHLYPSEKISLDRLADLIIEKKITVLLSTSRLFNLLIEEQLESLKGLRLLCTGGEAMSARHSQIAFEALPSCKIVNVYGPTENTTFTTTYVIPDLKSIANGVPIGKPVSNTTVYILDEKFQLVPKGGVGELFTGGDGLSLGYLNREELNRTKFIPNPFGDGYLYRTGDLASLQDDGNFIYCGRIDDQVKIRGFRIELGEVEEMLRKHHTIADCAVIAKEGSNQNMQLLAYIQPKENSPIKTEVFRDYLHSKLPEHMVPAHFVCLPKLPLTQNGKIDRNALPPIQKQKAQSDVNFENSFEQLVASLWTELFGWKELHPHTHFFNMGGDSLGAMKMISQLRKLHQVEVTMEMLFQNPLLSDFARKIMERDLTPKKRIQKRDKNGPVPLSYNQESLYLEDRLFPGSNHYSVPFAYHLLGKIDTCRLKNAWDAIVERHEILRTRYDHNGQPIIETHIQSIFTFTKASHKEEALHLIQEIASKPIHLEDGPVIKFYLYQIREEEHVALLHLHHIVMDDFAIQQMFKELSSLYSLEILPPPPLEYADFAIWQREFLNTDSAKKQLEYWKNQLKNAPDLLELPYDKPRPPQASHKGGICKLELESDLILKIEELAKHHNVSKFTVLLTVYFILLHRYSGKDDLLVGTPFANRNIPELEGLIGFCSQMAVIRADLSHNPSFTSLLRQVNRLIAEAQKNVDIPYLKLVAELNPSRQSSYHSLFQVGFGLENLEDFNIHLEGVTAKQLDVKNQASKFDLYLTVKQSEKNLECLLEYSTDLFEEETMHRVLNHYTTLLASAASQPEQRAGILPIMNQDEASQMKVHSNQMRTPYPRQTMYRRFEEIASQYPDHAAICHGGKSISYKTLNERANQLARALHSFGIKKEERIAVAFDHSPEFITALLAILKLGAVFVPIDSSHPAERRNFIIENSGIKIALAQPTYKDLFPTVQVFALSDMDKKLDNNNLSIDVENTDLSHIYYTSGSTGRPKGVKLTHRGVLSLVTNLDWFPIGPKDRVLHFTNISFDMVMLEIWGALLNGGTLCVYPNKNISLEELGQYLSFEKITHAIFTPRVLNLMVEDQYQAMQSLRYLISIGEAMSVHHAKLACERLPDCRMINAYGPTETTCASTEYTIPAVEANDAYIPIGRPLKNTEVYLLNDFLQPVPLGVVGELYIGGEGVALGYENRPDLTQERFIPNPFGTGLLYRTGDLCRFMKDGKLIYINRKDTQVKIRGFRVELGEVEEVLRTHPGIIDCVVIVKEDHLVAYVVQDKGIASSLDHLHEYASSKLPAYMVPNAFMEMENIPLTPNGKLDKSKLPAPKNERKGNQGIAMTSFERSIAQIWSQILNLEGIQPEDHFFKLGGSSIHAIQVISLMKKEFKIDVTMNIIFQYPVLKDFASYISSRTAPSAQVKIPKRKLNEVVRIPWNQESFWQIDLMIPNSSNYTMLMCFQLDGEVNIPLMKKAVDKIISRHESMRTRFEDRGDYRVQIIEERELGVFHYADLSNEPDAEEKGMKLLNSVLDQPFDLTQLPLIHVHLIKIGAEKFLGSLYVHHIVFDGWSVGVFFKEWRSIYNSYLHDQPVADMPSIQHADFACWQNEFFNSKAAEKQIDYWKRQIQGVKLIELPWDFPRSDRFNGVGGILHWALPESLSSNLKEIGKKLGVTLFELIIAAYKVVLYGYSGQNDLLVGSPFANRTKEEIEPLLGFFIHMFAIRTCLKGDQPFSEFLQKVSKTMAQAYENSDIPCERIFADLYPDWNPTFNRFQVGFSLDTDTDSEDDFEKIRTTWLPTPIHSAKFDLYLAVLVQQKAIHLNMFYCSALFRKETVEKMLAKLQSLLAVIADNPNVKIDLLLQSQGEFKC